MTLSGTWEGSYTQDSAHSPSPIPMRLSLTDVQDQKFTGYARVHSSDVTSQIRGRREGGEFIFMKSTPLPFWTLDGGAGRSLREILEGAYGPEMVAQLPAQTFESTIEFRGTLDLHSSPPTLKGRFRITPKRIFGPDGRLIIGEPADGIWLLDRVSQSASTV